MPPATAQPELKTVGFPWYLIWVSFAIFLIAINVNTFLNSGKLSAAVIAAAWACLAFSCYAKPFSLSLRKAISKAAVFEPLRPWISQAVYNCAAFGTVGLMVIGIVLKYALAT